MNSDLSSLLSSCWLAFLRPRNSSLHSDRSFKEVKLPPLVHPETLVAAAKRCVDFGGKKELLEAAALAGPWGSSASVTSEASYSRPMPSKLTGTLRRRASRHLAWSNPCRCLQNQASAQVSPASFLLCAYSMVLMIQ